MYTARLAETPEEHSPNYSNEWEPDVEQEPFTANLLGMEVWVRYCTNCAEDTYRIESVEFSKLPQEAVDLLVSNEACFDEAVVFRCAKEISSAMGLVITDVHPDFIELRGGK